MEKQNSSLKEQPKSEERQIIEGLIGEYQENFQEKLPAGITQKMVDSFLGPDGRWHWHLKSPFIKDIEERERYRRDKEQWGINEGWEF